MLANAYLQMRQMLGERKVLLVLLFCVLPLALCTTLRFVVPERHLNEAEPAWALLLFVFYPQLSSQLLAMLYGSTLVSSELDAQTLTYLFTRPVARWRVLAGKLCATALVTAIPLNLSMFAAWFVLRQPGQLQTAGALAIAVCCSLVAYSSLFLLLSFFSGQRPMVLALLYGMVEFGLLAVPGEVLLKQAAVGYHLRWLAIRTSNIELPQAAIEQLGAESLATAIACLAAGTVLFLAGAAMIVNRRELIASKAD